MKRILLRPLFSACALVLLLSASEAGTGPAALRGTVRDAAGRAVEGARIFAYSSPEVRKPGDFISAPTGAAGAYRIVLPPGRYWLVARLKIGDGYGPLKPGDKHSGEPLEIEVAAGQELTSDFMVSDLREARRMQASRQREAGVVSVSGRIVDRKGAPVAKAYAIANRTGRQAGIPDYISAWADEQGRYTLVLPPGKYHLGAAFAFPPGSSAYFLDDIIRINTDRKDLDIVIRSRPVRQ